MSGNPRDSKTPEDIQERINWAMRFTQTDLENWQEDDWAQANLDVRRFMGGIGGGQFECPATRRMRGGREDYRELKEWLREIHGKFNYFFLRLMRKEKNWTVLPEVFEFPINGTITYSVVGQSLRVTFSNPHSARETFITSMLLQLADDLLRISTAQLKTCPSCQRYFLAAGKQKAKRQIYDTPQCGNRKRVANYMKGKKANRQNTKKKATKI